MDIQIDIPPQPLLCHQYLAILFLYYELLGFLIEPVLDLWFRWVPQHFLLFIALRSKKRNNLLTRTPTLVDRGSSLSTTFNKVSLSIGAQIGLTLSSNASI